MFKDILKKHLNYNPDTGIFVWVKPPCNAVRKGQTTGYAYKGYLYIGFSYKLYLAHRLAWFWMTGKWPKNEIDHINGVGVDNRWCNLREATRSQNMANNVKIKNNTSGYRGVSWHKNRNKYIANIRINNRLEYLGYYATPEKAAEAYNKAATEYFGKFARLNELV